MLTRLRSRVSFLPSVLSLALLAGVSGVASAQSSITLGSGPTAANYTDAATTFFNGLIPIVTATMAVGCGFMAIKYGPRLLKSMVASWSK